MLYVNPQTSASFLSKDLKPGSKGRETEVLQQFEQLFVFQMLKEMRKTVPDYGVMGGPQKAYFEEMMDDFLAGEMAKSGQFGIAEQVAEQIAVQQDAAVSNAAARAELPGIPLQKPTEGFSLEKEAPSAFSLRNAEKGFSLRKGQEAGIPLVPSRREIARYKDFVVEDADRVSSER